MPLVKPLIPLEYELVPGMVAPPLAGILVPNASLQIPGFVLLYLNHAIAVAPFGLTVPFSVADVAFTLVGGSVVTVGGPEATKFNIEPIPVPAAFEAMAQ